MEFMYGLVRITMCFLIGYLSSDLAFNTANAVYPNDWGKSLFLRVLITISCLFLGINLVYRIVKEQEQEN